jgi:hypothetical protein
MKNKQVESNLSDNLIEKLIPILDNKGVVIPSKQDLNLLLENNDMKKIFQFFIEEYENNLTNKIIKKKVNFYSLNQKDIEKYFNSIEKNISLKNQIEEKKKRLLELKNKRNKISNKNKEELNILKKYKKKELLSDIKNKIISLAINPIETLKKNLEKNFQIENYKYNHCYFSNNNPENNLDNESEKENFNIIEYLNQVSSQISIFDESTFLNQTSQSKLENKNNQIIQLPKLKKEEIEKYTKLNQNTFFSEINKILKQIETIQTNNNLVISNSNIQKLNDIEQDNNILSEIKKEYLDEIQNDEKKISTDFNDLIKNNLYNELENENNELIKIYKIDKNIYKKICEITLEKIYKDLLKRNITSTQIINQFILPNCIIDPETNQKINYYRNCIYTYNKFKNRTDNFFLKRLLPLNVLIEEKYTDFINTISTEFDYFKKLKYDIFKNNDGNKYSLKLFKYNEEILQKYQIYSKFDLFTLYFKFLYKRKLINNNNQKRKEFTDMIYNNKQFQLYLKNGNYLLDGMKIFFGNQNFNEEYRLNSDEEYLSIIQDFIEEFNNIEYMSYVNMNVK